MLIGSAIELPLVLQRPILRHGLRTRHQPLRSSRRLPGTANFTPGELVIPMDQAAMTDLSPIEAYRRYLEMARHHENAGRIDAAFACLEAAHILGQQRTTLHVGAHVAMWLLACRQLDLKEAIGQVTRIVAAALVTWIWVPEGNTGRSGVSAFRQMSLPED